MLNPFLKVLSGISQIDAPVIGAVQHQEGRMLKAPKLKGEVNIWCDVTTISIDKD